MEVSLTAGVLELEGGHQLLQDVPSCVNARPLHAGGLVLSLQAAKPSSMHDAVLGQVNSWVTPAVAAAEWGHNAAFEMHGVVYNQHVMTKGHGVGRVVL